MKSSVAPPIYSQIAFDIASRISKGELIEGTKIYGRSVMSSEYGVSPETIRRALKLLADMAIVEIQHNSGAVILSSKNAQKYIERFKALSDIHLLRNKLKEMLAQQDDIHKQSIEVIEQIVNLNDRFSKSSLFHNYEMTIPEDSLLVGKTLAELKFWQETGATVIAIRREDNIFLSPGPYATLLGNDIIIYVGDIKTVETVKAFINENMRTDTL